MNRITIFLIFSAVWLGLFAIPLPGQNPSSTLKLVHVIFRHGNRNPDQGSFYPGDPYANESYYKEGYGQLINEGKTKEYNLGRELRDRFNRFLTETWNIKYLSARSSDMNRTKMSLELVLASLYPPRGSQMWSWLGWQPIPYDYLPQELDKELTPRVACSKTIRALFDRVLVEPKISSYQERYAQMEDILATHNISRDPLEPFDIYFGLEVQHERGYPLDSWTSAIFPEPLHSAAIDTYYLLTNTTALRRRMAGYLLKQILEDTATKINGTIQPPEKKMFLYSAHEINIASMLLSLDLVHITDVPPYGSYVLFEVHEINGIYGIKLFYQFYEKRDPIAIKLLGCDYFCPYDEFYSLVKKILPESNQECVSST